MPVPLMILVIIIAVVLFWIISVKNNFTRLDIKISEALAGIEVALEKRYDMLNKLLDVTKSYMKHETETLEKVISLRKGMALDELVSADNKLNELNSNLVAYAENYPELRSSEVFVELQKGIIEAEEHLQAARRLYNANVTAYNTAIAVFPDKLLANGLRPRAFYEVENYKKSDVDVNL